MKRRNRYGVPKFPQISLTRLFKENRTNDISNPENYKIERLYLN